jgi:polysaccharide deacetylase 2 family uncharacterized protein YibQ
MADDMVDIKVTLARMEEKQDAVHALIAQHLLDDKDTHQDFESRLRSLEKTKWRAHGVAAAVGGLAAYVVHLFKQGAS